MSYATKIFCLGMEYILYHCNVFNSICILCLLHDSRPRIDHLLFLSKSFRIRALFAHTKYNLHRQSRINWNLTRWPIQNWMIFPNIFEWSNQIRNFWKSFPSTSDVSYLVLNTSRRSLFAKRISYFLLKLKWM